MTAEDQDRLALIISQLITALKLELPESSIQDTARRIAAMYREVFSGVAVDPATILSPLIPIGNPQQRGQLVVLTAIQFSSMCSHHFLPFYGLVTLGYVTGDHIVGLGKFTRLVETLTRRPQLQEQLTDQLADYIETSLKSPGVAVHISAKHLCEAMRGTHKENQILCTSSFRGKLSTDSSYQVTFLKSVADLTS